MLEIIDKLGEGTYGCVYRGRFNNNLVAIKIIRSANPNILNEIDIMSRLVHPNLMHSKGLKRVKIKDNDHLCIIMSLAEGDLRNTKNSYNKVSLLRDIALGIKFLHANSIIHLDIKLNNCLVQGGKCILADYGMAQYLGKRDEIYYPHELIAEEYRPIENFTEKFNYSKESDIWSFGVVILKLMTKNDANYKSWNKENNNLQILENIFCSKMLRYDIKQVLSDSFFVLPEPKKSVLKIPLIGKSEYVKSGNILQNYAVNLERYIGFYHLLSLCYAYPVKLETVFLAGDLYQRFDPRSNLGLESRFDPRSNLGLESRFDLGSNPMVDQVDYEELAKTCFCMACKMLESFAVEDCKLEMQIVEKLEGILYRKNLFTTTYTLKQLQLAFSTLRNSFIYPYIDFDQLEKMNEEDQKQELPLFFSSFEYPVISPEDAYFLDKENVIAN